jgi:hypothetical protein
MRHALPFATLIAASMAGCSGDVAKGASGWRDNKSDLAAVRRKVSEGLIDPTSAYFTDVKLMRYRIDPRFVDQYGLEGLAVCGWVRGRNALGAMQGPVAFVYTDAADYVARDQFDGPPTFITDQARLTWANLDGYVLQTCAPGPDVLETRNLDWRNP